MATTIAKLAINTTLDSSGVAVGAAKTQGIVGRLSSQIGTKLSGAAAAAGTALLAAGAAAFGLSKGVEAVASAADRIDRIGELSERYDIEAASIQRLGIAAKLGATDQETLMKAIQKMSLTIGTGGMPLDKRFIEIAKSISTIEDPGERAAKIMEVFGKSGLEASNLILTGAAEVEQAAAIVERFGIGLTDLDVEKVATMNDKWDEFGTVVDGIWQKVTVQLAPVITDFLELSLQGIDDMGDALAQAGIGWEQVGQAARASMTAAAWSVGLAVMTLDKMAASLARTQALLLETTALTQDIATATYMREGAKSLRSQADGFEKRAEAVANAVARFTLGLSGKVGGDGKPSATTTDLEMVRTAMRRNVPGVERGSMEEARLMLSMNNAGSDPAKETAEATKRTADSVAELVRMAREDGGDVAADM